ncbi:MAG: SDR family oxidoreductase [Acidimicrobiales bacterium]
MTDMLADKVVVVSGVGPGLGRSIAVAAAREGARVALVARNEDRLGAVAGEIEAAGGESMVTPADITDEAACRSVIEEVAARWGRVDGLANNAFQQPPFETLEQQSLDSIRSGFEINLLAHLSLTKAAAPIMRAGDGGAVVMTLSSVLRHARPYFGAYKMAKHALLGMARSLAVELGPDGIRVNSIAPGYIYDDPVKFYFQMLADEQGRTAAEVEADITATHALRHIPTPDEIADAVVFLLSDHARVVTGQCLDVNGGEYMV